MTAWHALARLTQDDKARAVIHWFNARVARVTSGLEMSAPMSSRTQMLEDGRLLVTAAAGGLIAHLAGVPAGWLTGAMVASALVGLWRPWRGPSDPLVAAGMLLSGALIGASATPEAIAAAARYPLSLALLLGSLFVTILATGAVLRAAGWSRLDALLAAAPGALSAVMAVARERSDRLPQVSIIQFFRLFVLVAAAPGLIVLAGVGADRAPTAPIVGGPVDIAAMLLAGLALGLLFRRAGIVAPIILGSTLASMVLHGFGLVRGTLPTWLAVPAFVILGGMIGARLGELDGKQILRLLPLALAAFVTSVAVAVLFAWPASRLADVEYGAAFVAFAPGGLEAMALLALALGLDPLYVGAHHLVRFMVVGFCLPLLVAWLLRHEARGGGDAG
jgi:hypothetical protein